MSLNVSQCLLHLAGENKYKSSSNYIYMSWSALAGTAVNAGISLLQLAVKYSHFPTGK